jgi:hypothetical protein
MHIHCTIVSPIRWHHAAREDFVRALIEDQYQSMMDAGYGSDHVHRNCWLATLMNGDNDNAP